MKNFLKKLFLCPLLVLLLVPQIIKCITSGDCGSLDLIYFDYTYRKNFRYKYIQSKQSRYYQNARELLDNNEGKILVIGDSFAKETKFQDYLSEIINKNISTLQHMIDMEPFLIFNTLMTEKNSHIVILESVERVLIPRLVHFQIDSILDLDSICYKPRIDSRNLIERAQDFYMKKIGMVKNVVLHEKLSRDLFTCKGKVNDLFFYVDDIFEYTENDINKAYENLEFLHKYALTQGIYLIYMVAADKYDVYQQFIVDNPYKYNDLLSKGNRFDSLPYFINTKYVLTEAAENGVKDIYWADDTHWSPIGAKIVAEEIARRLNLMDY